MSVTHTHAEYSALQTVLSQNGLPQGKTKFAHTGKGLKNQDKQIYSMRFGLPLNCMTYCLIFCLTTYPKLI